MPSNSTHRSACLEHPPCPLIPTPTPTPKPPSTDLQLQQAHCQVLRLCRQAACAVSYRAERLCGWHQVAEPDWVKGSLQQALHACMHATAGGGWLTRCMLPDTPPKACSNAWQLKQEAAAG